MPEIDVEAKVLDVSKARKIEDKIFGDKEEIDLKEGITIKRPSHEGRRRVTEILEFKTFVFEKIFSIVINLGPEMAASAVVGVLSNWLYDKLKDKTSETKIENKEAPLTEDEVKKAVRTVLKEYGIE